MEPIFGGIEWMKHVKQPHTSLLDRVVCVWPRARKRRSGSICNWASTIIWARAGQAIICARSLSRGGQPVALLVWGPACYALKDRDRWISLERHPADRAVEVDRAEPAFSIIDWLGVWLNLASQALAAALRVLPSQWQRKSWGCYQPLWAESVPIRGLCGHLLQGQQLGTGGLERGLQLPPGVIFVPNERPKRLWLCLRGAGQEALVRGGGAGRVRGWSLVAALSAAVVRPKPWEMDSLRELCARRGSRATATPPSHRAGANDHRAGAGGEAGDSGGGGALPNP